MNTFVTSLQFVVLVLCLYGELTRRIKSTFPVTVALGTIFVCTLVSMSKSFSQRGLDDALFWAGLRRCRGLDHPRAGAGGRLFEPA